MEKPDDLTRVTTWIFDLDNTLYSPEVRLFDQIQLRMTAYVMRVTGEAEAEADRLRTHWWERHGTTLAGLMADYRIDPHDYLADVHDIDFSALRPDPALAAAIQALPGRKVIHTNADSRYAARVLACRELSGFEAVCGIEEARFHPKPDPRAYAAILSDLNIDPRSAAFFEDDPRNLLHPHRLGMQTILVGRGRQGFGGPEKPQARGHVGWQTDDLADFLRRLVEPLPGMAERAPTDT